LGRSTATSEPSELAEHFTPGPRYGGRLKPFMDYLVEHARAGERQVIVSRQIPRMQELWMSAKRAADASAPEFMEGTLSDGWVLTLPDGRQAHLLTDSEIFGWERPQPRHRTRTCRRRARVGLHRPETRRLGRARRLWHRPYIGLVRRTLDGAEREFLAVEYEGGDQIFVPVYQADRLSRYIGPGGEPPTPRAWAAASGPVKQRVRESVQQVAQELLELYARRQVVQGTPLAQIPLAAGPGSQLPLCGNRRPAARHPGSQERYGK
jgi:transcription-repair coupling factor (superfamily II helicase)